jgi:Zn-finger protein
VTNVHVSSTVAAYKELSARKTSHRLLLLARFRLRSLRIQLWLFQNLHQCELRDEILRNIKANKMMRMKPAPNITCWGGQQYKVKQGDTCESIAKANSLAMDLFLYQNGIDFNCKTLTVGNDVCIRGACKTYVVRRLHQGEQTRADFHGRQIQSNQTCKTIARDNGFTKTELIQWNPILESNCDALDVLKGRTICITSVSNH